VRKRRPIAFESSALHEAILWVLALKIAGLVLLFDPSGAQAFDLPKSLFSRATEWVLAALIVATVARHGLTIVPRTRLHLAVAAFLVANVLAAVFAENRYVALFGDRDRYLGLTFVLDMIVLYVAAAIALRRSSDWVFIGGCLGIVTVIALAYAAIQQVGRDPFPWAADPRFRPFATFGNPDMFAQFLAIGLGISSGLFVAGSPRGTGTTRVGALVFSAAVLIVTAFTATRSVLVAIASLLLVLPLISLRLTGSSGMTRRRIAFAAALGVLLLTLLMAVTPMGSRALATFTNPAFIEDRLIIYRSAVAMITGAPVLGHGVDNFAVVYPRYRLPEAARVLGVNVPQSSAHSWPLQAAATTGLVGVTTLLASWLVCVWLLFTSGLRRAPWIAAPLLGGLAAYAAAGLVSPGSVAVDWFPWLAFGGTASLLGTRPAEQRRSVRPGVVVVLVVVVLVGIASNYFAAAANREVKAAQEAWNAKRGPAALSAAQTATQDDSGRSDYWNWLGLAWELQKDDLQARAAYGEAATRAPYVATFRMNEALALARLDLSSHRSATDAINLAKDAVASDPNEPSLYANLANIESAAGQADDAVQALLRAIAIYPRGVALGWDQSLIDVALSATDLRTARQAVVEAANVAETARLRAGEARLALKDGDLDAARAAAKRALALDPANADAAAVLKQIGS
jgi:tetratricopeptide (TPR) repeat protein